MIDYRFKSEVLKTDIPRKAQEISKALYANYVFETYGEIIKTKLSYDTAQKERCFLLENHPKEYAEAEKINYAKYKRANRLRERIKSIIENCDEVVFLTLTFKDDVFETTTDTTRRRYVQRLLTDTGYPYVGNIDFGAKNGREHYHAVVGGYVDFTEWTKHYGFAFSEFVKYPFEEMRFFIPNKYKDLSLDEAIERTKADSEKRLSKYISKLTNHAIKETTKRNVCIYSRKSNKGVI